MDFEEEGYDEDDDEYVDDYEEFVNPCQELIDKFEYRKAIECLIYNMPDGYDFAHFNSIQNCFEKLLDYEGYFHFCSEVIYKNDDTTFVLDSFMLPLFVKLYGKENANDLLIDYLLGTNLPTELVYHRIINSYYLKLPADKAIEYYKGMIEKYPTSTKPFKNIGKIYHDEQNHQESQDWYFKALELSPNDIESILGIASNYLSLGDKHNELKYLHRALEIDPDNSNAKMHMHLSYEFNRREEVVEEVDVSNTADRSPMSYYDSANKKLMDYDFEGAIVDYTKAIDSCNDEYSFPWALKDRGLLKIKMNKREEGLKDIILAEKLDPSTLYNIFNEAISFFHSKLFDKAINGFTIIIEVNPKHDEAFLWRAKTFLKIGKREEALSDLNEAIKLGLVGASKIIEEECDK